ncbi:uncharacterized protein LOC144488067, partial [Mustelus asterias]
TDPALTDPCENHTVLDDTWRSADCKEKECSDKEMCDQQLNEGWYRFKSSGGWKILETRVAEEYCSTHHPGWLQGSHPTLEQGEGSGTVCFNWDGNLCSWKREIKIKNCSSYFVYELKPTPGCDAAYCTDPNSVLTDPCVDHTVLNQPWRSSDCTGTECVGQRQCDKDLVYGWYRFNSSGGWKIPETRVAPGHCSTHHPGWLQGSHPTLEQGEVNRTVCFLKDEEMCEWKREIKIKNCSSYFVYELKPTPGCEAAYCTDPNSALTDPCVDHTVLNQPWRSSDCTGTECVGQWKCDKDLVYGWYRFNSSGGWKIPETRVAPGHCSTHHPGWLQGSHPTLEQGEVNRTVCFLKDEEMCEWKREIKIKNCSSYFVYELKPTPGCEAAYCTDPNSALTDPCVDHTVLNQPWRSSDCTGTECVGQWKCDKDLVYGWYRFNSSGGWKIPETRVAPGHCSTHHPGWLQGSHPTLEQGEVNRTVCFTEKNNECKWEREIKIKNCNSYFVYELKPTPGCEAAYCTGKSTTREAGGKSTGKPTQQSSTVPVDSSTPGKSTTREAGGKSTGKPTQQSSTVPVDSSTPGKSTTREAGGKSTGKPTQQSSTVPVDSSTPGKSTTREAGGKSTGKPTQQSSTVPVDSSAPGKSTTREAGGKSTGKPTQQSSTVPVDSSAPGKSTTREAGGKSTGKPTQQSSTVPVDSSAPGKSTTREAGGKSTGKPTQQSSTVPVDSSAPGKSKTWEAGGKSTGKPTQQSSTVPVDSSAPGKSKTWEAGGKSTGKPTQQSSTVPVDSSAPGKSTTREAGGKSTGKPTQQSSTVPVDSSTPGKSTTREAGGKSTGKPTQQSSTVPVDSSTPDPGTAPTLGADDKSQPESTDSGSPIPTESPNSDSESQTINVEISSMRELDDDTAKKVALRRVQQMFQDQCPKQPIDWDEVEVQCWDVDEPDP